MARSVLSGRWADRLAWILVLPLAVACTDVTAATDTGLGGGADTGRVLDGEVATRDAASFDADPALDADRTDATPNADAAAILDAEAPEPPDLDEGPPLDARPDAAPPVDAAVPDLGADPPPDGPSLTCTFDGPADEREVNTWRADVAQVRFVVPGLADPARLRAAYVRFRGWDLDTPGREGHLQVNDGPLLPLPADPAYTNAHHAAVIQVDPVTLRAGDNTLKFLAFDQPEGAYFRISQVQIETQGPDACPVVVPPPPPDDGRTGQGRERTLGYREATYTQRRNWVLDCRDYAYTARGAEHEACDGQYNPDGSTHGTATFRFGGVVADRYTVRVEGRLTENRNPRGTLVRVGGNQVRIDQRSEGEVAFQSAGEYVLSGDVDVVIDSTQENGSDSVRRVQLQPVTD